MIDKILAPLDGSAQAERVLGWAAVLAKGLPAEVELFGVVEPHRLHLPQATALPDHPIPGKGPNDDPVMEAVQHSSGYLYGSSLGMGPIDAGTHPGREQMYPPAFGTQLVEQATEYAERYLHREAERLTRLGVGVKVAAAAGTPSEEIAKEAERIDAGLITMVTHRHSAMARGILGSVTDRTLRLASMPILVAHPESDEVFRRDADPIQTVIVPLDGSKLSEAAVPVALDIARAVKAAVRFLQVLESRGDPEGPTDGLNFEDEAYQYLDSLVERAGSSGVSATAHLRYGAPADAVLDELERSPAPLAVMSTRGRGGVNRWVLGSVSDKVVRGATGPVVIVPPARASADA